MRIDRIWAMPSKNTFQIKPIKEMLTEEITEGLWIDPFANTNKFAQITNDLNPEFDTTYHMDALDFLRLFDDKSIDGVLYDPPFLQDRLVNVTMILDIMLHGIQLKHLFGRNIKRDLKNFKNGGEGYHIWME